MNLRKAAIQVPCQMAYDDVWRWENGLIKVSKEGLWDVIDERGNVVIPVEDDSLSTWPFPGFFSDLPSVCSCRTETARNNEFSALGIPLRPISRHGGGCCFAESPFPPWKTLQSYPVWSMLNGEYHPEEGWNDGLWVRENVSAVRHLQHGLHLPVPGAEVFVLPGQPGQGGGLPVAPGEDPAAGRSPAPGGSPSPARRRASGSSPRTPPGM